MIGSNRRLIIREIAEDLNISYGSIQNILTTDLNMRRVSAKFDNVPCHSSLLVRQFLSNKNIMVCPHTPCSSDLAPYDFWLFPRVKMAMKGKRFESIQNIDAATTAQLTKEDFQNCFRKCQEWWDKCVRSEGGVLRGINGNVFFTVIFFFYLNIDNIFLSHLVCVTIPYHTAAQLLCHLFVYITLPRV